MTTLTSVSRELWAETATQRAFERMEPKVSMEEVIVSLRKCIVLEVDVTDSNEIVEEFSVTGNRGVLHSW